MALKLTKADDYAVRAMIHLACLPDGRMAMRSEIAEAQGIPSSFMAKILRSLVRAGLLRSSRGVNGGFALARGAAEVNLLEIVEAIEGSLNVSACVPDPGCCPLSCECPAAPVWFHVQESIQQILEGTSLETLVSTRRRNGRIVEAGLIACSGAQAAAWP
jgi:Rrf2 family protein